MRKHQRDPVRRWLWRQDLTQGWLAKKLGVSDPYLSQILSAKRPPSITVAFEIERITGVPARTFVRHAAYQRAS
jgi:transcriptional regulator with XRE-family HTH domain